MAFPELHHGDLAIRAHDVVAALNDREWRVSAPAKINLRLRVLGRRSDGYHLLSMLNTTCSLSDDVVVSFGVGRESSAVMNPDDITPIPCAENLALRAHSKFWLAFGCTEPPVDIHVRITKRIPVGGGLGGGSSDAGAVLRILSQVFGAMLRTVLDLSESEFENRMINVALGCGADVPFAYRGGVCWVTGIGEQVRMLGERTLWPGRVMLAVPSVPVPTLPFYDFYRSQHPAIVATSDPEMERLRGAPTVEVLKELLCNDFEADVRRFVPEVGRGIDCARQFFPYTTSLTGSGACFFSLVDAQGEELIPGYRRALEQENIEIHEVRL